MTPLIVPANDSPIFLHVEKFIVIVHRALRFDRDPLALGGLLRLFGDERFQRSQFVPAPQPLLDGAVNDQIGIPADRGGEVTVMLACQPEMPLVLPAVARFLHGAEHYAVYEIEFPRAFEGFQNPLKVFGRDRLRVKPRAYAQRVQIGAEPSALSGAGRS